MKKGTRIFLRLLCIAVCIVFALNMAPVSRAAGMMRFIIGDKVYTKVYNDMGSLALTHYHYDVSEDKLSFENFGTSDSPETPVFVYPYSGEITIELKGNNYIKADREMALIIIGNATFTGSGTLNIISADTYGIYTDYSITVTDAANLNVNALAGITALKGFNVSTSGTVNIHTTGKCVYTYEDIKITKGSINFTGSNGLYSAYGNVFISGGETDLLIDSTSQAIYAPGENAYIEWSANAAIYVGSSAPGYASPSYNNEKYLRMSFSGPPKLNPPREIYWDDTVIDSAGATNPVGRWSPVENATGYEVYLYYYNDVGYSLTKTFTVTDALSCNFGGYFTNYGKYYFSVRALGDDKNYITSNNSSRTTGYYYFTGEVESRFYVSLPESDYFKIIPENGSTVVYYGEDYSFTVEVDPAYTQSEVLVWANGVRVALRHGKYTIDNVTENLVIKIGDMAVNTYTVNLPEHEAYTIYPLPDYSTNVEYGGSFAFSVELSDIYLDSDITVTSNGEEIIPKYGIIYTIKNITEDQTVEITGLVRDNNKVIYQHLDGTFITSEDVDYGSTATAPSAPALAEGLEFVGWSLKDGTAFDFNTPIEGETVLYARFAPEKQNGYYVISTLDQLLWFRDEVNFGNTAINAKLAADISINDGKYIMMSGIPNFTDGAVIWKPIGGYDYNDNDNFVKFYEGSFDGCGHTISGLYISYDKMAPEASDLGLFGGISESAVITNLNVAVSNFDAYGNMGGVVGTNYGVVEKCTSSVVIKGVEDIGGVVGENHGSVIDCTFNGIIEAEEYTSSSSVAAIGGCNVGGIAGNCADSEAKIIGCVNNGTVKAKKNAGGIVGTATSDGVIIENCRNTSEIYADTNSAGILGNNPKQFEKKTTDEEGNVIQTEIFYVSTTLKDCSNSGIISSLENSGGIVTNARVNLYNSTNSGKVTSVVAAGGIAADVAGCIDSCINNGTVEGTQFAGGISSLGDVTLLKCINNVTVVSGNGCSAGIAAGGAVEVRYSYNLGAVTGAEYAGGIAAGADSAKVTSCHNYASVSAIQADGIYSGSEQSTVERSFSVSEIAVTSCGTNATKEMFYCGYVAINLNGSDETSVWAQGDIYPVFADENNPAYPFPFSGDGTQNNPYVIMNENELRTISAYVNNQNGWSAKHYKLGADITISNTDDNNFVPFGTISNQFAGSFDGDGHTISGVNISIKDNNVGLFRSISATAIIRNLNISGFNVSGLKNTGTLIGANRGSVSNCRVTSSYASGSENIGGVVGYNLGPVSYTVNGAQVKGENSVGGIAGLQEAGKITYCINLGTIGSADVTQSVEVGGITGESFEKVEFCGNLGNIYGGSYVGGVIGISSAELRSLYNYGTVSGSEHYDCIIGYIEDEDFVPELCFTLKDTSSGLTGVGDAVEAVDFTSGMLAYWLNNNGTENNWAQGESYPVGAQSDGSDAVVHTVTYYSFGELYYTGAAKHGGAAVTPPVPYAEGYNFLYWDTPFDSVEQDMVTRAVFDRTNLITYTPTSTLDYTETEITSAICGIDPSQGMTVAQLRSQISNKNIVIMDSEMNEYCNPDEKLYTGMTVILYGEDEGVYLHIANVVIFGDITGDGKIDDADAFMLNMLLDGMIWFEEIFPAQVDAADINRDGDIDDRDSALLQQYLLYDYEISQSGDNL